MLFPLPALAGVDRSIAPQAEEFAAARAVSAAPLSAAPEGGQGVDDDQGTGGSQETEGIQGTSDAQGTEDGQGTDNQPPMDAGDVEAQVGQQLSGLDLSAWEELFGQTQDAGLDFRALLQGLLEGDGGNGIWQALARGLGLGGNPLRGTVGIALPLIGLALLCAVLQHLGSSFEQGDVGEVAQTVLYLAACALLSVSLLQAYDSVKGALETMLRFVNGALPIMVTLVSATGHLATAATVLPSMTLVLGVTGNLIQKLVLPALLIGMTLTLVNGIDERKPLSGLVNLLRSGVQWLLGVLMTIMVGVLGIQGVSLNTFDGVSLQTAKYAVDSMVPVAGGLFSDMVDSVLASSLLIKNALGTAGLMGILLLGVGPLVQVLLLSFGLKLGAAVVQPLGADRMSGLLEDAAKALNGLVAVLLLTGILLILMVALLTMAGSSLLGR